MSDSLEAPDQSSDHDASPRVIEVGDKLMDEMREKADARLAAIGVIGVTKEAVADIVCSLIEDHLNALRIAQNADWLPDEILTKIFSMLATQERSPLARTCKRFRNLDLELGKRKFDKIRVTSWGSGPEISFYGVTSESRENDSDNERKEYELHWRCRLEELTSTQTSINNLGFFRKAETELLDISLYDTKKYAKDLPAKFDLLSTVLRTVTFKKLSVHFENVEDSSESFLTHLLINRNLESTKVSLTWVNVGPQGSSLASMQIIRNLLQQLPRMDNLKIDWVGKKRKRYLSNLNQPNDRLIDYATLLHIVSNTNYTVLRMSDCSVLGLLNAFAVVSKSENKYAFFIVNRATFVKLCAMECETLHKKYADGIEVHFVDRVRKYVMIAAPYKKLAFVIMGRMDDNEKIIDSWPKDWDE